MVTGSANHHAAGFASLHAVPIRVAGIVLGALKLVRHPHWWQRRPLSRDELIPEAQQLLQDVIEERKEREP
jgi:hypothetical protein